MSEPIKPIPDINWEKMYHESERRTHARISKFYAASVFWQGKHAMLRLENNALRRQVRQLRDQLAKIGPAP